MRHSFVSDSTKGRGQRMKGSEIDKRYQGVGATGKK